MTISTQFNLGKPAEGRRIEPESPLRILILADWLGDTPASATPDARRPVRIDIDNFDQVMAGLAPSLDLEQGETLQFRDIEGFHPDRLCQELSGLKDLLALYRGLDDPARVKELMATLEQREASPTSDSAGANTANDLERLLGGRPPEQGREPGQEGRMRKMLGELVSPHLVDTRSAEPHRQAVVARLTEELDQILHASRFQALEANWRALWWLVSQLVSEDIQLALLPMTGEEIRADLHDAGTDLDATALSRHMIGSPSQPPWSLAVGLHEFGSQVEDIMALTAIAMIAESAAVPFVASANPRLAGCDDPSRLVDPALWVAGPHGEALELWQALRQSSAGRWVSLVLPGVLARLPYGPGTDPIDCFGFSEDAAEGRCLPRFGGAVAATAALGIHFEHHGGDMDPAGPVALEDLPGFSFSMDGEACFQSAVEVALPDRALDALIQRGFTPLAGAVNRTDVHLPGCYALSGGALRGRWSQPSA